MSREPRSLTLTHRQLWKQCLLPVTCVIGRHHLYELVISTRTRGTGGRCGEQPKDMKYFSGRMAPRGRGAARLGTEPRRYCRGCFTAFFLNSANREADLQRCGARRASPALRDLLVRQGRQALKASKALPDRLGLRLQRPVKARCGSCALTARRQRAEQSATRTRC